MKEKVKSAPKELVRRGLDDGTERLRGQLRDTAQRGQADDYGGDRIEDTAAGGARRAERGIENLLKKKKAGRRDTPQDRAPSQEAPAPEPGPEGSPHPPQTDPAPTEPRAADQPRIKTREAVAARESGRTEPASAAGSERQRIKIRESAVHSGHGDTLPASHDGTEFPQRAGSLPDHTPSNRSQKPLDRLTIKTRDAHIQGRNAPAPEQPPQALVQGGQEFTRERGRAAAIKQAEARRAADGAGHSIRNGGETSVPARRGYAGKYARTVRGPASPREPDARPVREGGRAIIKTARSGKKTTERAAKQTIKTAERSSKKAVKTAQQTAKTAQRTIKTTQKSAQATAKAAQRAVQTARAAAKTAAATARAAAKAAVAAIKAAIAAMQELIAAIAAAGLPVLLVVVVICLVGLIAASPFGIFFSIFFPGGGGRSSGAASPSAVIAEISGEYADRLSALQAGSNHDSVEILGGPPAWTDVLAVFSAKTTAGAGADVAVLDTANMDRLKTVFWDMTKITTGTRTVNHPAVGNTAAWEETVLTITVTPRTPDDMQVFYSFTEAQNQALDDLLAGENRAMWQELLYGNSSGIVAVALSQVGNVGGQPYWSWYGFNSRVEWCACFVSWCANECGYIDAGVIPKTAGCVTGSNWFKARGQWQDKNYEPHPGDIIYFDWDNKGSSGPQDGVTDHVGIVERVENGVVYTVEGNSGDSCRQRSYSVGHYEIYGYGTPIPG